MTVIGAIARSQESPESIRAIALNAEDSGLEELWLWEDSFYSAGISMSASILATTERLRVGIGVMPTPFRNVALAAMEIATLERLFPGRFMPGFGHGIQDWMGQAGVRAPSYLGLAREYFTALRALLAGEEVTVTGDYVNLDRVELAWAPDSPPLIHFGGTGPKSLAMSGAVADGSIAGFDTVEDFARAQKIVASAREEAGWPGTHQWTIFADAGGDAPAAIASAQKWADAGAHRVVFAPMPEDPDPIGFVRFIATQVQGRVR